MIPSGKIDSMQRQGLSTARLYHYVSESPTLRTPVVEDLISKNSDVKTLNDLTRLNVLPPDTAARLIEESRNGGMSVPRILERLKDWNAGSNFRDLLIDQVKNKLSVRSSSREALFTRRFRRNDATNIRWRE